MECPLAANSSTSTVELLRMRWQDATRESFLRLARKIGDDETLMASRIEHAGEAIMTAWHASCGDFGYTTQELDRISSHLARVPLFSAGT